ncbi:MAG: 16S rRNA (cytidine(1402)-2'-O)-methyltransferase [Mesorhizobium amorphae]|nr:MAG: 16S rRNA (cytidine(1402)-2'-O)-methyltransferase [Mesorhizobium amorphae]
MIGSAELRGKPVPPGLHLVATPIGNLSDITIRALETLAGADVLACEDTRTSRVLLDRYGIRRRTVAYHEHNAAEAGPRLLETLEAGGSVALISDAGTPLVSDPGFRLVEEAARRGHSVIPVPGPSAALAGLTASGLPTDAFLFAGFLPVKAGARERRLEALRGVQATLVFFESPRRLGESLEAMAKVLGEARPAAVARELTKAFEEIRRGTLAELAGLYADSPPKGEVVVCVGAGTEEATGPEDVDRLLLELSGSMPASKAAAEAARLTGRPKSELYQRLVELKGDG